METSSTCVWRSSSGEHAVPSNQKHTDLGGDGFDDWMNLAGCLKQSDRWRDAMASLASIFFLIKNSNNQISRCHRSNEREDMLWNFKKAYWLYKWYSSVKLIDYCCYKTGFLKTAGQQQSKETLVRGDMAAVMEVKNTKVIKVTERKRDWHPLLSLVILMSSLTSQRGISPESCLRLPLKASFLFSLLFVVFLR